jgi:hypothetical protein
MFYRFSEHKGVPDVRWNDDRHATVYHKGRVWEVREDEASDWLVFVRERAEPVHRITSGGCSEAFRWIAGRPRGWAPVKKGGNP